MAPQQNLPPLSLTLVTANKDLEKQQIMASSPSQIDQPPSSESDSQFSSVVYDLSQQVQMAMTNMLKMISEIDQKSAGVVEEIDKCKNSVLEKKKVLEEEKEQFQKAAYAVLSMLNNRD